MKAPLVGEAAVDLPWLAPCAASLVALSREPVREAWDQVRCDPGAVLLLLRHAPAAVSATNLAELIAKPNLLEMALDLYSGPGCIAWSSPFLTSLQQTMLLQARVAQSVAARLEGCDPDLAWVGGLLAPLGWLAIAAVAPEHVARCREHPRFEGNPTEAQQQCWGFDHTAIARRLARRWQVPPWLAAIVGHLGLPAAIAQTLGADPLLFQGVQLAVGLVNERGRGVDLPIGATPAELNEALGLNRETLHEVWQQAESANQPVAPAPDQDLLPDLLRLAMSQRRHSDRPLVERLQQDVDRLQSALEDHCAGEKERLQAHKLLSLAELAAGAGHEINNPLAVISGQAQYLLSHETDPERRKALHVIVNQAQRIHQILIGLMQFARPGPAHQQAVELGGLIRAVTESLGDLAGAQQVGLVCPEPPPGLAVLADPGQARTILHGLFRNAIEAAPAEGWAGIRVHAASAADVEVVVEDNGPGPPPGVQEHMFDPFYSGRSAGRGLGLGLATAWRLARHNDGDVRFAGHADGLTRFVLRLSRAPISLPEPETNGQPPLNGTPVPPSEPAAPARVEVKTLAGAAGSFEIDT